MKKNQTQSSLAVSTRRTFPRGSQNEFSETPNPVHGSAAVEDSNKLTRRSARLSIPALIQQHTTQDQTLPSPSTAIQDSQSEPVVNEISRALDLSSARMTCRKRPATLAQLEDQEEGNKSPPKHTRDGSGGSGSSGSSGNSLAHICLCQPDPKIPRPRNAFILYRQRHQAEILAQHPGLPNPEISKIAGELWKAEPESVKNEWKLLAEEEKARHAQLYPDYRFRPRHKTRRGSGSSTAATANQPLRCNKCGGRSIAGGGSPFSSPLGSATLPTGSVTSPTPTSGGSSGAGQKRYMPQVANLSLSSPRAGGFGSSTSPTANRFQEGMQDPKRRRFSPYPAGLGPRGPIAGAARSEENRPSTGEIDHRRSYSNNVAETDPRRQSLQYTQQQGYAVMQPSRASIVLRSPPATGNAPSNGLPARPAPIMGPPSARPIQGGRGAMPPTPTSARLPPTPHGLPIAHRPSLANHDLRLPPLQTSPGSVGSRDLSVQVMSLNFLAKIKLLRTVAAPLSHSRQSIAPGSHIRGAIIAIEGEDWAAVDTVKSGLEDILSRDFDIRIVDGPPEPKRDGVHVAFADYMSMISEWHSRRTEILRFLMGDDESLPYQRPEATANGENAGEGEAMDVDGVSSSQNSESRRRQPSLFGSTSSTRSAAKGVTDVEDDGVSPKAAASSPQASSTPKSNSSAGANRIPLLIIPHYILHTSNVWASALPINDTYSPADHWQWVATLWRGTIGPDFTVYVRGVEEPETAVPSGMGKPAVDIREDLGALIVKGTGRVEEGSVRRVAFEVGEWARISASG